jgi:hypothetical protein
MLPGLGEGPDILSVAVKEEVLFMKKSMVVMFCVLGIAAALHGPANAAEVGHHYVNGVEGIKAATLPPPGFYYRMYNVFYNADEVKDAAGDEVPVDFDLSIYALVNRLIWISDIKILGADFGADVILPLVYSDIDTFVQVEDGLEKYDADTFALGDIVIEPFVLSWHTPRHDASFGVALYTPTGKYDKNSPETPGEDMWTVMFTLGGTRYLDAEKTWSASILARYEIHSEKDEVKVEPGDDFHFEWGIGKTLAKIWDVGLTGYCHWQVTDDSGSGVRWDKDDHDRVYAIGPEVSVFVPPVKSFLSLRTQWEFKAKDRPEGNCTSLTLTKMF